MNKNIMIIVVLLAVVGLGGWLLGMSKNSSKPQQSAKTNLSTPAQNSSNTAAAVKSIISYTVPSGMKETNCPGKPEVYVTALDGKANCESNPVAPVILSIDAASTKDCSQLQNVQNVSKHVCKTEYINDHKSVIAETIYNQQSSYKKDTDVNAYYIDTGKGVVKVEYSHDPSNSTLVALFDQLAHSMRLKN